jgi:hypothetical protein
MMHDSLLNFHSVFLDTLYVQKFLDHLDKTKCHINSMKVWSDWTKIKQLKKEKVVIADLP